MTLDSQRHKICVSSAGHTPLLFYSKKDNLVLEANVPAGLPLGIMEEAEYQDATIDLEKGDRVVLFTDGLSEARNRKCQEFGVERIKNIISQDTLATSEKILERMKEEVLKFSHRCPQHDDITIIVISACE
jgi:sigma-B regulation protein RsbU (phosphoserine phosphatase)